MKETRRLNLLKKEEEEENQDLFKDVNMDLQKSNIPMKENSQDNFVPIKM